MFLYRPLLDVQKILIEISKKTFKKYFKDTSNSNQKYLRTKIRNLRILWKRVDEYDQIIKSIKNLASSKATIDKYFKVSLKDIIKKKTKNDVEINFNKFSKINIEFKIRIINEAIKKLKGNYYNLRSKKVISLIDRIQSKKFKRTTLGGCIFSRKKEFLSLKIEKT